MGEKYELNNINSDLEGVIERISELNYSIYNSFGLASSTIEVMNYKIIFIIITTIVLAKQFKPDFRPE